MSLYDKLGNAPNGRPNAQNAMVDRREALNQAVEMAKANYKTLLQQKGWTVPDGMTDPEQMVQHLVQSGQVPQNVYQAAVQWGFGGRR